MRDPTEKASPILNLTEMQAPAPAARKKKKRERERNVFQGTKQRHVLECSPSAQNMDV